MPKVPYNSITEMQATGEEDRVEDYIQRDDLAIIDIIPNLPTNAAVGIENTDTCLNDLFLLIKVLLQMNPIFIFFPEVIRRRCHN